MHRIFLSVSFWLPVFGRKVFNVKYFLTIQIKFEELKVKYWKRNQTNMLGTSAGVHSQISRLPKITVIIASYNSLSQSYLAECLESVKKQNYKGDMDIVIADGGSTDGSVERCKKYGAKVVHNSNKTELGFEGGKNLALKCSKGELIAIVDADNILMEESYITQLVYPFMEDGNISMSFPAPYIPSKKECTGLCRYICCLERDLFEKYYKGIDHGSWIEIQPDDIIIPNGAIIKKDALDKIGGWDYDTEVGYRLVISRLNKFAYVPNVHRFHKEMLNYNDVKRKFARRIINHINVSKKGKKARIQMEINEQTKKKSKYIKEELSPLINLFKKKDFCYIHAIPVFMIKTILVLKYYKNLTNPN